MTRGTRSTELPLDYLASRGHDGTLLAFFRLDDLHRWGTRSTGSVPGTFTIYQGQGAGEVREHPGMFEAARPGVLNGAITVYKPAMMTTCQFLRGVGDRIVA